MFHAAKKCPPLCDLVRVVFRSRDVHPCYLVPRCQVSIVRDVRSRDFSRPAVTRLMSISSHFLFVLEALRDQDLGLEDSISEFYCTYFVRYSFKAKRKRCKHNIESRFW